MEPGHHVLSGGQIVPEWRMVGLGVAKLCLGRQWQFRQIAQIFGGQAIMPELFVERRVPHHVPALNRPCLLLVRPQVCATHGFSVLQEGH